MTYQGRRMPEVSEERREFGNWGTVEKYKKERKHGYVIIDGTLDEALLTSDALERVGYTDVRRGTRLRFSLRNRYGKLLIRKIYQVGDHKTNFDRGRRVP